MAQLQTNLKELVYIRSAFIFFVRVWTRLPSTNGLVVALQLFNHLFRHATVLTTCSPFSTVPFLLQIPGYKRFTAVFCSLPATCCRTLKRILNCFSSVVVTVKHLYNVFASGSVLLSIFRFANRFTTKKSEMFQIDLYYQIFATEPVLASCYSESQRKPVVTSNFPTISQELSYIPLYRMYQSHTASGHVTMQATSRSTWVRLMSMQ